MLLDWLLVKRISRVRVLSSRSLLVRGVFFDIRDKSSSGRVKNYTAKPNSVSEFTSVELQMVPKGFLARAIGFQPCPSKVGYIVGPLRPPCFGLHSLIKMRYSIASF